MIEIRAPRNHDRVVLIAKYKIAPGYPAKIKILYGAYKGEYEASSKVLAQSPIEPMETRSGRIIAMKAVPLDALERISHENN